VNYGETKVGDPKKDVKASPAKKIAGRKLQQEENLTLRSETGKKEGKAWLLGEAWEEGNKEGVHHSSLRGGGSLESDRPAKGENLS